MSTTTVTVETLDDAITFDSPFTLTPADASGSSTITDANMPAPEVALNPDSDVEVDDARWRPLTGHTGQYRYSGAVMHPSEVLAGGMADAVLAEGGTYVVVEVCDEDGSFPEGDPIGWAILRYVAD